MAFGNTARIYFIGIGGIGMSALARYFLDKGIAVSGYDATPSPITEALAEEGARIHFEDDPAQVDKEAQLVVYTPAIPDSNDELNYCLTHGMPVHKRSEVLEMLTEGTRTVAVSGSHGKTTVSAMVAHLLSVAKLEPTAFLGGVAANFQSNFLAGDSEIVVAEADEFDRSLLRLQPEVAIITAADPDHHDVYATGDELAATFVEFGSKVPPDGLLLVKHGLDLPGLPDHKTYHLTDTNAWCHAKHLETDEGGYYFDIRCGDTLIEGARLNIGGRHNVENALAAVAASMHFGVHAEQVMEGLHSFAGLKRRFEYVINSEDFVFIDDYAHHPAEIKALLGSVRELYPGRKITAIFQPHLFSRTQALADQFAESLEEADELILMEIYPAREEPIPGVTSDIIYDIMELDTKILVGSPEEIPGVLDTLHPEILLTIGAGDIDRIVEPLKNLYA